MENYRFLAESILTDNILPFWLEHMTDRERGGYYGRISGEGQLDSRSDKGAILNARILWAFSAAYRVLGDTRCLEAAKRAKEYLSTYFLDREFGGIFWNLDCNGRPVDTKKQFYALGFAIYGLSEFVRATGDSEALDMAVSLFHDIEDHSRDRVGPGYMEACTRDWKLIEDMRLSSKDENEAKTMNTHLHIMEPYTNLLRVWDSPQLKEALRSLIEIFLDRIYDPEHGHLGLFFDEGWCRKDRMVSYGHDIEASWLLLEAAETLGDEAILNRVETCVKRIYTASLEGLQPDGSMIYEIRNDGTVDRDRHWWVQAETVVGSHWNHRLTGSPEAAAVRDRCLGFITSHLIDREGGEWHWSVRDDGSINTVDDKAGFWKCPYHNTRMCLELMEH